LAAYKIKAFGPTLISSVNNSFQDDHFGLIIRTIICKLFIPPDVTSSNAYFLHQIWPVTSQPHSLSGASLLVFHTFGSKAMPLKHHSSSFKIWNNTE